MPSANNVAGASKSFLQQSGVQTFSYTPVLGFHGNVINKHGGNSFSCLLYLLLNNANNRIGKSPGTCKEDKKP